jgi:hypothetical protein
MGTLMKAQREDEQNKLEHTNDKSCGLQNERSNTDENSG